MTMTERQKMLWFRIEELGAAHPELARPLVSFAWACVQKTPLAHLHGRSRLQNALLLVQRWLNGEPVEPLLRGIHDEAFEAALGAGRFEPDMTGWRAACWSVFELYQAALAGAMGERQAVARKVAWAVSLAARSGAEGLAPSVLDYQESLFDRMLTSVCAPSIGIVEDLSRV
jgi:hypothetical protein